MVHVSRPDMNTHEIVAMNKVKCPLFMPVGEALSLSLCYRL